MNREPRLPRIVVLISGEGTNLQAVIDATHSGVIRGEVTGVFSDRAAARGLARAQAAGILARWIGRDGFPDRGAYESALAQAVAQERPDAIVLAGFMRILGDAFTRGFHGRMVNVHPSLLPSYRGLDTHARVLAAGDERHGATVHFVTEELDAGPRIMQYRIPVRSEDTPESLAERVQRGEHVILPRVIAWLVDRRLRLEDGNVMLDGERLKEPVVVEGPT